MGTLHHNVVLFSHSNHIRKIQLNYLDLAHGIMHVAQMIPAQCSDKLGFESWVNFPLYCINTINYLNIAFLCTQPHEL